MARWMRSLRMKAEGIVLDSNVLISAALSGGADFLIAGDRDLLVMSPFREIPFVTPATFLGLRSK